MALAIPPEEDDQEDHDDELESPVRTSFFTDGERADELVCADVYRIYVKESLTRGLATPADLRLTTGVKRAPERLPETETEPEDKEPEPMTEPRQILSEAHARLLRTHGGPPSAQQLFDELGAARAKSVSNIRQSAKRAGLELARLRAATATGEARGGAASPPPPKKTPRPRVRAGASPEDASPASSVHSLLAITALQGERAKVAAELAAIDSVIDRLRG